MTDTPKRSGPFKGLMPYTEEDAQFFFGRTIEREIIIGNLLSARLTLLYGASGIGKTSLLHAGVASKLRSPALQARAEVEEPTNAVVVFGAWTEEPTAALANGVRAAVGDALGRQIPSNRYRPRDLIDAVATASEQLGGRLLIILDQFEEYFQYHEDSAGDESFAVQFPKLVNRADIPVSFLISIREDLLASLDRFKGRIPLLFDNYLRLEQLSRESMRAAIEGPIEQYNRSLASPGQEVAIEPDLLDVIVAEVTSSAARRRQAEQRTAADAAAEQAGTPLLQLVMTRLWDAEMRANSRVLRVATLDALGGVDRIFQTHLDTEMQRLSKKQREIAARLMRHLATRSGTKLALSIDDLAERADVPPKEVRPVLERLAAPDIRLLRSIRVQTPSGDQRAFEIFHDVLVPVVSLWCSRYLESARLRAWIGRLFLGLVLLVVLAVLVLFFVTARDAGVIFLVIFAIGFVLGLACDRALRSR